MAPIRLRPKTIHRGAKVNQFGGVSALCFETLRPINLALATWTNRDEAVTCPKCRRLLKLRDRLRKLVGAPPAREPT